MSEDRRKNIRYLAWEIILFITIMWMGLQMNNSHDNEDNYTVLLKTDIGLEDEMTSKLTAYIDFIRKHRSTDPNIDRKYIDKGLIYLSGVLNAVIKKHYADNKDMKIQCEKLLNINNKILNDDSLSPVNLKESLVTASNIIAGIQSVEFPDLTGASRDLMNSALEVGHDESFDILKFRAADYFEKAGNIFIAMIIIASERNNAVKEDFYRLRST